MNDPYQSRQSFDWEESKLNFKQRDTVMLTDPDTDWKRKLETKFLDGYVLQDLNIDWKKAYRGRELDSHWLYVFAGTNEDEKMVLAEICYVKGKMEELRRILIAACDRGWMKLIRYLIEKCGLDPSCRNSKLIVVASRWGHYEVVEYLLSFEKVNPEVEAMWAAAQHGDLDVVRLLINDPRSDPNTDFGYCGNALSKAVATGRTYIVEYLINDSRIDPSFKNNRALRFASELRDDGTKTAILAILLRDDRVRSKLTEVELMKYENMLGG